uniref:Uncharacterized protein n=1 Tax=Amphimedon queenslandica TaxID=400682 RepID=A0A1X7UT43_AMPQE
DRGLGREEAVIINSGSCLWLVHVLTWHKDYNVVLKSEVKLRMRLQRKVESKDFAYCA